ncbi:hypothetical protein J6590_055348 [Homalodisca vitripennis]|nr:hypothetical protein J6590_055348 [Homalodisca vitripennis]
MPDITREKERNDVIKFRSRKTRIVADVAPSCVGIQLAYTPPGAGGVIVPFTHSINPPRARIR